jgi:c-di-GMP-binding flagellar brake protein YcgR
LEAGCSIDIGGTLHTGITGNISRGGLYLQSLDPSLSREFIGKIGQLSLKLDDGRITTPCRIVFIGGEATPTLKGVGVEFQMIPEEVLERLKELVSRRVL